MSDTFQLNCIGCGNPVEVVKGCIIGVSAMCDECSRKERHNADQMSLYRMRKQQWNERCPPLYADTLIQKLPLQHKTRKVLWDWRRGQGLNLYGEPRTGKSRTAILLLKTEHYDGQTWAWYSAQEFTTELESRQYHRSAWLKRLGNLDIVVLDDFDKLNLTTEMKKTLFCLLDERIINKRSTFLTHNSTAEQLEKAFWDLGKPLVSRLRESFLNVHFGKIS